MPVTFILVDVVVILHGFLLHFSTKCCLWHNENISWEIEDGDVLLTLLTSAESDFKHGFHNFVDCFRSCSFHEADEHNQTSLDLPVMMPIIDWYATFAYNHFNTRGRIILFYFFS